MKIGLSQGLLPGMELPLKNVSYNIRYEIDKIVWLIIK